MSIITSIKAFEESPVGQQVWRFGRLAVVSAVGVWIEDGHQFTTAALVAAAIAGIEVVYRAVVPSRPVVTVPPTPPAAPPVGAGSD